MTNLVDRLRSDHRKIVQLLSEVLELGIGTAEGRAKLLSAKAGLLAHLALEDEKLYPRLEAAAIDDPTLRALLEEMFNDMRGVTTAAIAFFAKYERGGNLLEFAADFGRLYAALGDRIRREECSLYLEFERIAERSSDAA